MVLRSLPQRLFDCILCNINNEMVTEDCYSYQLTQEIIEKFMKIRLLRYGQYFREITMQKSKSGIKQKLNKSVIFQGL